MKKYIIFGFLFLLIFFNCYSQNGLVLDLDFNKKIIDKSSENNSITNNNTQFAKDKSGGDSCAVYFNGSNANLVVKDFGQKVPNDEITMSLFLKTDNIKTMNLCMLSPNNDANRFSLSLFYRHSGVSYHFFDFRNTGAGRLGTTAGSPNPNKWYHFVFISSRALNKMEMYIDGVLYHSKTGALSFVGQNSDLLIGSGRDGFYNGHLDEFKIFSRVLSKSEIDSLGAAPTCKEIELNQEGIDSVQICLGDSIQLNGKTSLDNIYSWTPQTKLINHNSNQPIAFPNSNQLYVVSYKNENNQQVFDSFFVEVIDTISNMDFIDTLLCGGSTLDINISNEFEVIWSDGQKLNRRTISEAGIYALEVKKSICSKNFNFEITTQDNPNLMIEGDLIVCEGDSNSLSVTAIPNDLEFTWVNEGFNNIKNRTVPAGLYKVTGSNECGLVSDSITIQEFVFDEINYEIIYDYCVGDTVRINFSQLNRHLIDWNDGNTNFIREITEKGSYNFTITENNCKLTGSFEVFFLSPPYLNIETNFSICNGVETAITPIDYNGKLFWDNLVSKEQFTVLNRTVPLPVRVENKCGIDSILITFDVKDCNCYVFLPNAFTPNHDRANDIFRPIINCDKLLSYHLTIFNLWGEKIYQTVDPLHGWDGTYRKKMVDPGVYFYYVDYKGEVDGLTKRTYYSGTINVLY